MPTFGSFSSRRRSTVSGDLSARQIVGQCDVVGLGKGHVWIQRVASELLRKGPAKVYFTTWTNTGYPIGATILPWAMGERDRLLSFTLAVRSGVAKLQPKACVDMQTEFGPRALVVAESHAEVMVFVGDGWCHSYLATDGAYEVGCFGSYVSDSSPELAQSLVAWFESLPAFSKVFHEPVQRSLAELVKCFA